MRVSVLSVDLGTSNTVAVLAAHDRPPRVIDVDGASMMPSCVYAAEDGTLIAGREAERRARLDPSRFEPNPKRRIDDGSLLLGDRVVPVTDALAAVLRKVAEETKRQLGASPDQVRLTHPAQWGPVRRNTLLSAARQAGLGREVTLVPEPVAAASHFAAMDGHPVAAGQALAVYDLGAGTFDVAIVGADKDGFTVLAEAGLPDLGGLDIDQALLDHVGAAVRGKDPDRWALLQRPESTADRRLARALREDIKVSKESLSNHPQTDVPLPDPFGDFLVTRAELEQLIRPNLVRSVELLAATIRSAGLSPTALAGVYLVGGSSRIPLVATLINEHLRVVPTSLDQPETAVALGAHHMSAAGLSLRTKDNPVADESRTTSVAPPPRLPAPPGAAPLPGARPGAFAPHQPPQAAHQPGPVPQAPHQPGSVPQAPHQLGSVSQAPHQPGSVPQAPHQPGSVPQAPHQPGSAPQAPHQPGSAPQAPHQPGSAPQAPHQPGSVPQAPHQPGSVPQAPHQSGPLPLGQVAPAPHSGAVPSAQPGQAHQSGAIPGQTGQGQAGWPAPQWGPPPGYPPQYAPGYGYAPSKGTAVAAGVIAFLVAAFSGLVSIGLIIGAAVAANALSGSRASEAAGGLIIAGVLVIAIAVLLVVAGIKLVTTKGGQVMGAIAFGLLALGQLTGVVGGAGAAVLLMLVPLAGLVLCVVPQTTAAIRHTRRLGGR